ncbi:hypothetical protein IZ6_30990 [Terrihabitans soli]|uniref:Glycosyltransferase 61 catalytic domain-containing protein n=2 Tax=Terrihabitans soli TaxID=708113 RepID=A0A6S6QP71_9HYPH|nr:hypothetical protein IZ6_30990 [Terrihabitans soli]
MTLDEQIDIFSNASHIVGPTGAGFANMLFAPQGCQATVLVGDNANTNLYFLNQIAHAFSIDLTYVVGSEVAGRFMPAVHNDYSVDISLLDLAIG